MVGHEMPSASVARQFLYAFHEEAKIEEAKRERRAEQIAYIPEETEPLVGLGVVNRELVRELGRRCPEQRIAERADERGVAQGDFEDSGRGRAGLRGSARQRDTRMCRGELCAGGEIGTQRYAALTLCGDSDSAAAGNPVWGRQQGEALCGCNEPLLSPHFCVLLPCGRTAHLGNSSYELWGRHTDRKPRELSCQTRFHCNGMRSCR